MLHIQSEESLTDGQPNFCVHDLIRIQARRRPDAPAIAGPGRAPLAYGRLCVQVDDVVRKLNAMGVGRNERVALALPNGPELAVAMLGVAAAATSAPLDPASRAEEFEAHLTAIRARALIVQAGFDSPARAIAHARGITIVELSPMLGAEAGLFALRGNDSARPARHGFAEPGDAAVILPTSNPVARSGLVPLTHMNLCASAFNIGATLRLLERDRCLNLMPLFEVHGLVSALVSSLVAGAGVFCAPEFSVVQFYDWLQEFRPTWFTAAPATHQIILAGAHTRRDILAHCPLRFVRSLGRVLPAELAGDLERVFKAPVIEGYGLTEAADQITSNLLPPGVRKPGSSGKAAGPEVAIMDRAGHVLARGRTGEIVIRGPNVALGPEGAAATTAGAAASGWLRTGDLGYLDQDGFLFITQHQADQSHPHRENPASPAGKPAAAAPHWADGTGLHIADEPPINRLETRNPSGSDDDQS